MHGPQQPPAEPKTAHPNITVRPFQTGTGDARQFGDLNKEWIMQHFALEAKDLEYLNDPEGTIINKGGYILMACLGTEAVGCVALLPMPNGVYELSKMAVSPKHRGRGIGRLILKAAIATARNLGAASLFLGSNTKLANAVHLYESVGFRHVPPDQLPKSPYIRANVFMEMPLDIPSHSNT